MKCQSCGRDNVSGAAYCAFCGAQLQAAAPGAAVPIVTVPTPGQPPGQPPTPPPPPPAPPPQMPGVPYPYPVAPPEPPTSGMAVASLILGILGFFTAGLTSVVGLILGIAGLVQISNSEGRIRGQGLALAGTLLSGFTLLTLPIMAAILFPVFARAREKAQQASCQSNLKQVGLAALMYAQDYDEIHPMASSWCDAIQPYTKNTQILICPAAADQTQPSYAYNAALDQLPAKMIPSPAQTVMAFDSQPGQNLAGGPSLVVPRHNQGANFAFADGHLMWAGGSHQGTLVWSPLGGTAPGPGVAPTPPWAEMPPLPDMLKAPPGP